MSIVNTVVMKWLWGNQGALDPRRTVVLLNDRLLLGNFFNTLFGVSFVRARSTSLGPSYVSHKKVLSRTTCGVGSSYLSNYFLLGCDLLDIRVNFYASLRAQITCHVLKLWSICIRAYG